MILITTLLTIKVLQTEETSKSPDYTDILVFITTFIIAMATTVAVISFTNVTSSITNTDYNHTTALTGDATS